MTNFLRAVQLTLRHRLAFVLIFATALGGGVLWGANITAVYPFVEVVFHGRSMHDWAAEKIREAQQNSDRLAAEIDAQQRANDAAPAANTYLLQSRLKVERRALAWFRRAEPWIRAYTPATPFGTLLFIVAALLVGTLVKNFLLVANMMLVERVVQQVTFDLRKQFYRQTLRWELAAFQEHRTSELLSRLTYDLNSLAAGLSNLFGRALREPLKMVACIVGASLISWQLLLFSLLLTPLAALLVRTLARSIKRASRRALEEMSCLYNKLTETYSGIQTIKAFNSEQFERNRFHQIAKLFLQRSMRIAWYTALSKPITELLGIGVICLALVAGAHLVLNRETHLLGIPMCQRPLSPGALLMFYGLLIGVSDPARKLSDLMTVLQGGAAAADRVYVLLDREPQLTDPPQPRELPRPHQRLVFHRVSFAYAGGEPVLRDVDLEIPQGQTVAIVGPNGCGKTTLINLIGRFYDPTSGAVQLGGVDLRELRMRDIRERIGLVTQQTYLFDDTVLNNIRYGSPQATDEQVIAAARQAHAHDFITTRLADGYQTLVGQGGSRLSGGQRQRLALARAILRDPEILILDEATSQIDVESEHLIHQTLQEFVRGRTALMITHRLSTLALAHRVVVMDEGRIVAAGTHAELLSSCPLYARLHSIHFRESA